MSVEIVGYENLHLHSHNSLLDGYGMCSEYTARLKTINQRFLCLTDHGTMAGIPEQIKACEESGIHPLYGCELYINPLQPEMNSRDEMAKYVSKLDDDSKKKIRKSYHLIAIAKTNQGYSNLVRLTSWAYLHGFYYRPRINHEMLIKHKEGIIFSSACFNNEIGQASARSEEEGFAMVEKYKEMLGDNFYLEMMLLDFDKQKPYNQFLIKAHDKYGIPLIITNDCHYCLPEDSSQQRLMLMIQTGTTLDQIKRKMEIGEQTEFFELQDTNLWLKSEEEINAKWASNYADIIPYDLFKQAKQNTVKIAEECQKVEIDRTNKLPRFPDEENILWEEVEKGLNKRGLSKTKEVEDRLQEEYQLICQKEFCAYFLIQKMITDEARRACAEILGWGTGPEAVGPGRGSGAGCLINYLLGITDVNPLLHGLMFSRFLSPARGGKSIKLFFAGTPCA